MHTDTAEQTPERLLQAFLATDYEARIDGRQYVLHPGRLHKSLDAALAGRPWAVVTAFNPRARLVDESANRKRHQDLLDTVAARGWEVHPAVNRDPCGTWPDEKALLIVDADLPELDGLAERFEQAAIVTGRTGEPAVLRLYGSQWPQTLPDWARRVN